MRPRPSRRALGAILAIALVITPARMARADGNGIVGGLLGGVFDAIAMAAVVGTVAVVLGAVDVGFTAHDIKYTADGHNTPRGWSIGETVLAAPQAVAYDALVAYFQVAREPEGADSLLLVAGMGTSGLATRGIWGTASVDVNPVAQFGVSYAVGANLALTSGAVAAAANKKLPGTAFGFIELIATAPSVATGAYKLTDPKLPDKAAWGALTAWSGALCLHGAASFIAGLARKPRPAEPRSAGRRPFMLVPMLAGTGPLRAPGIAAVGAF